MGNRIGWVITILMILNSFEAPSQHTSVFSLMKSDERLADDYVKKKDYKNALELYKSKYARRRKDNRIGLKIANCYYLLKEYQQAFKAYEDMASKNVNFSKADFFSYAEASASIRKTEKAAEIFRELLNHYPNDTIVENKLWQLSNIQYLYEDSIHYAVRAIDRLNSSSSDIVVSASSRQLIFLSDRPEVKMIEKVDAAGVNLYNLYQSKRIKDTTLTADLRFSRPVIVSGMLNMRSQAGPMAFFDNGNKVVYATTNARAGRDGKHTLQLNFAEKNNSTWEVTGQFPFNNIHYSLTDPWISNDGNELYFVSDMPGGKGGKDIYHSIKVNDQWTKPENVAHINSAFDDITPFSHLDRSIYFSSNGFAGIGGFDIFKIERRGNNWTEVTNVGYPINSSTDDFGFIPDTLGTSGYFTSNRKNSGLDDDMYNVEIDVQHYPITIAGLVQIKEHSWSDSSALTPYGNSKVILIDNLRNTMVYESKTDSSGAVYIEIPYFTKYKIKIIGPQNDEHIVSFDIPKNSKLNENYEIVLVKDMYENKSEDSQIKK